MVRFVVTISMFALVACFAASCAQGPSFSDSDEVLSGKDRDIAVANLRREMRRIQSQTGVEVVWEVEAARDFPSTWLQEPVSGRAQSIDLSEAVRFLPLIDSFLKAYPRSLLRNNLRRIVIVKRLQFFGKDYGGTNSRDAVFAANQGLMAGYDGAFLLGVLHAEFSSILLRNHANSFDAAAWDRELPAGFEYGGTGVEMLGQPGLFERDAALLERGFLIRYAQSSRENDFNAFAKMLLGQEHILRELEEQSLRIRNKGRLARGFYKRLGLSFPASRTTPVNG